ncbi:MAG: carboxypeptidase regulatory-like domain-containing protein [Candidatus Delongbacteria bacterium]|nr:carboxypeptidase regulatory-like domain-containing protein [Candidatus Delongbacteria bacterium]
MNKIMTLIVILSVSMIFSKTFQVTSFAEDPYDKRAQYRKVPDIDTNKCAMLKVETDIREIQFNSSDIKHIIDYSISEKNYRMYIQQGVNGISLNKSGYTTFDYKFPVNLRPGVSYVMRLAESEYDNTFNSQIYTTTEYKPKPVKEERFVYGNISGVVKDAYSGSTIDDVSIIIKKSSTILKRTNNISNGTFKVELPEYYDYTAVFQKDGYQAVEYHNISVEGNRISKLEPILQIDEKYSGKGHIAGYIFNSINNEPVMDAEIKVRKGVNTFTGTVLYTAKTDADGNYYVKNVASGNYTIEVGKEGYSDSWFTIISLGGETIINQNTTMLPDLDDVQIRVVLTWGDSPRDLDAHLFGPEMFHISCKKNKSIQSGEVSAELDFDDTYMYGPETITIHKKSTESYEYVVQDYTNRKNSDSKSLSNSGAKVRVYRGQNLLKTFFVPMGKYGNTWNVFKMQDSKIVPINELTNEKQ